MLLLNKTLMKLARGSWPWILAIAGVGFLTLMGTTALAEIIAGFLGDLFQPQTALATAGSAVLAAGFTFLMQLLKGLLEYKAAARARESMRRQIFSKVLELDAGGIEKIGPVSAITASVDAVEQMLHRCDVIGAILLECSNLTTFAREVAEHFDMPVFDVNMAIRMLYRSRRSDRYRAENIPKI